MVDIHEVVTLNGNQYRAFVDRTRRQIVFKGDVPIAPTDEIIVNDMAGSIDAVEHDDQCTVVKFGGG